MSLTRLTALFTQIKRHDYIGEAISQYEHALQCAYFAEQKGHSKAVIIASLLHDIGHVALATPQPQMAELGVINHEWIGARLALEMGLSRQVATLIGYHVQAKRYLAAKKPIYKKNLSPASQGTLKFQGGPMSLEEQVLFEALPSFREILQVRTNDEKGKETEMSLPDFNHFLKIIEIHINKQLRSNAPKTLFFVDEKYPDTPIPPTSDITISSFKPQIGSPLMFDYNLSVKASHPHFFLFLDESISLIEESVLNQYTIIASDEWIQHAKVRYPEHNWVDLTPEKESA
jgi:predicted HD phosphohydrolase